MRIPMKVDYGVRALVELAMHFGEGQVQTSEIASKQGIPEAYLEQLMTTLNNFGLVRSHCWDSVTGWAQALLSASVCPPPMLGDRYRFLGVYFDSL